MIRICFVCLGNICRSPMAEFIMKEKVKELGLEKEFLINSKATSYEEEGNDIYPPAKEKLREKGIPFSLHQATRLESRDLEKYDYFIGMDDNNLKGIERILKENSKIRKLLNRDISDPWYTRDFEKTYQDIEEGIEKLLEFLIN